MVNLGLYSPVKSGRTAPTSGCSSRGRTSDRSWSLLPQMCQSRDVWGVQRYQQAAACHQQVELVYLSKFLVRKCLALKGQHLRTMQHAIELQTLCHDRRGLRSSHHRNEDEQQREWLERASMMQF